MKNFIVFLMLIGAIAVSVVLVDKYYYFVVPDVGKQKNIKIRCYLYDRKLIEGDLVQFNDDFISVNTKEGVNRVKTEFVKRIEIIKCKEKVKRNENVVSNLSMKVNVDNKRNLIENNKIIKRIRVISKGEGVDIRKYIIRGKVVIFDFYADWCKACNYVGSKIEGIVEENKDVVLMKINIVNWDSPVAKQFHIRAIPYFIVYDKKGRIVGKPTTSFDDLKRYISIALTR